MQMMLRRALVIFKVLFLVFAEKEQTVASAPTGVEPASVSAGVPVEIKLKGTINAGDKADFSADCAGKIPATALTQGTDAITVFTVKNTGKDQKLCYAAAGGEVQAVAGIALIAVDPTLATQVESITPKTATGGVPTKVTLTGAVAGSKAIFIPKANACKSAKPNVDLDDKGIGTFNVDGPQGQYKLCYQAPGGTDSAEQVGTQIISLMVFKATSTKPDVITAISPSIITVNVPTMLTLSGAAAGDTAIFVNAATGDCAKVTPEKDVGAGHAMFTIPSTGTYTLCYKVPGASDSVAQAAATLTVKAPGVTKQMINQWQSKNGELDCTALSQVANCAVSSKGECNTTFMIKSGIGYKCAWDEEVWPPACAPKSLTDSISICKTGSCGGAPSQCW